MNSPLAIARPERLCRCAVRTLLLALPLSGIAFQLPPAQAQPTTTLPAKPNPRPLSPEQKATIKVLLEISRQEKFCKKTLDFKIEDGTLEDVVARVKQVSLPEVMNIEVRGASPVRVGFDLKQTHVGNVLNDVAALAGCKLFLLPNGLLLAPPALLSEAEAMDIKTQRGGEWSKSTLSGGTEWSVNSRSNELFTRVIAEEATGKSGKDLPPGVTKTTFGDFSPESQAMLRDIADNLNDEHGRRPGSTSPIIYLDAASPVNITVSNTAGNRTIDGVQVSSPMSGIAISFGPGPSNPGAGSVGLRVTIVG